MDQRGGHSSIPDHYAEAQRFKDDALIDRLNDRIGTDASVV